MVDTLNPTSQFHPYQPPEATPVAETNKGNRLPERLQLEVDGSRIEMRRLARLLDPRRLRGLNRVRVGRSVDSIRTWARNHPGQLAALIGAAVIGTGLLVGTQVMSRLEPDPVP